MFERICSFAFNLRYYSYGFKFFVTNGANRFFLKVSTLDDK